MTKVKCNIVSCVNNSKAWIGTGECLAEDILIDSVLFNMSCSKFKFESKPLTPEALLYRKKYCKNTSNESTQCPESRRICCCECPTITECTSICCNLIEGTKCANNKMYEE